MDCLKNGYKIKFICVVTGHGGWRNDKCYEHI